ncbi:MAG TPA: Hsp70 family protein, partial [Bryobacteraceae bacterium]|nr:Hsp70 family protein [Bryobacteraceae bacterium]
MTPLEIDFGKQERVVGIDLGTTNSLVAYMDTAGHPSVIPGEDSDKLVPSVVTLTPNGEIVVGNRARAALIDEPDRTVYSIK